jgi:hypothetical protein
MIIASSPTTGPVKVDWGATTSRAVSRTAAGNCEPVTLPHLLELSMATDISSSVGMGPVDPIYILYGRVLGCRDACTSESSLISG